MPMNALATLFLSATVLQAGADPWTNLTEAFNKASGKGDFRLALGVDRLTGTLFVSRWATGVWVSSDQGTSFMRADGGKVGGGGPFSCYALYSAPEGGKLAVFNMNNKPGPSGYSLDGGKTWESFESVGRNWDYGAIDWESKTVFAARHEHEGAHLSRDMGKTWTELDVKRGELKGLGVFGPQALVISNATGIRRSEDEGKSWTQVSDHPCTGTVQVYKEVGYWLSNKVVRKQWTASVAISRDGGRTWKDAGPSVPDTMFCSGPFFGKSESHMVVATLKGILETTDGGATWKTVADYPADAPVQADHKNGCGFPSLGYDANRDLFYVFLVNMKDWPEGQLLRYARRP
jgi:hypothetical protein